MKPLSETNYLKVTILKLVVWMASLHLLFKLITTYGDLPYQIFVWTTNHVPHLLFLLLAVIVIAVLRFQKKSLIPRWVVTRVQADIKKSRLPAFKKIDSGLIGVPQYRVEHFRLWILFLLVFAAFLLQVDLEYSASMVSEYGVWLFAFIGIPLLLTTLWFLPKHAYADSDLQAKEKADVENAARDLLLKLVGGVVVVGGVFFTANQVKLTRAQVDVSKGQLQAVQNQIEIQRKSNISVQFSSSIDLLAQAPKINEFKVMSGIYALGKLTKESPDYRYTTSQIIIAYLRKHSKRVGDPKRPTNAPLPKLRSDFSACFNVFRSLQSFPNSDETIDVNLKDSDIRGIDLSNMHLTGIFTGADLSGNVVSESFLSNANFDYCWARGTDFTHTNIRQGSFKHAHLEGAFFNYPEFAQWLGNPVVKTGVPSSYVVSGNFTDAHLENAHFQGTALRGSFRGAHLEGADFSWAQTEYCDFTNATFLKTDIRDCDLGNATGLTQAQVNNTIANSKTRLPPGLKLPRSAK